MASLPPFIQTEQDLLKIHNYIPKDLVSIISDYLPSIDFTWTSFDSTKVAWCETECDARIEWRGPLTSGIWNHGHCTFNFNDGILIHVLNGVEHESQKNNINGFHKFFQSLTDILSGKPDTGYSMRLVTHDEARESGWINPVGTYYNNPTRRIQTWWIFKCDMKVLIEEIKFVINTITTNPNYNRAFFSDPGYQTLL